MEVKVKLFGDLREGRFEEEKTQLEGNIMPDIDAGKIC